MCPHITFLEWVRRRSNQYTRRFERHWGLTPTTPVKQCQPWCANGKHPALWEARCSLTSMVCANCTACRDGGELKKRFRQVVKAHTPKKPTGPQYETYFEQYKRGWNVSTTDQQYKRALANLKSPNMHVMWLETLDHGGWKRFEDYLTASGVVPWINTARRTSGGVCANSSLSACAAKKTVHENANGRRRRSTQISHHYAPTDAELSEAARINHHDVALHAALTTP